MHFVALASTSKAKKCPAYVGNSCEANKNDPVPRVALSQRAELFWHALHSGHDGGLFAGAASPFLLSPFSSFLLFLFSLSSHPLSVFVSKNQFGKARARTAAMRMVRGASRISLRAVDACEASLLRSEASKPVFWRGQNAKINKIQCSSKTKKI